MLTHSRLQSLQTKGVLKSTIGSFEQPLTTPYRSEDIAVLRENARTCTRLCESAPVERHVEWQ